MPAKNEDLHGNAPDKSDVALLLIDVINDLEFPEGDQLLRHALPMARQHRRPEAAGQAGEESRSSTSTTTSAAGGRTSTPRSNTASTTACAGRPVVGAAAAGRGRLLRPQAQALGLFLHHARHRSWNTSGRRR